MTITELRQGYHRRVCREIITIAKATKKGQEVQYPSFADGDSKASVQIAWGIVSRLPGVPGAEGMQGQTSGGRFEAITKDFLEGAFELLTHLRPGRWHYSTGVRLSDFEPYRHLANLAKLVEQNSDLASSLGTDYIVKPDIVIARWPVSDEQINRRRTVVEPGSNVARLTALRSANVDHPPCILHASISCKWTLRSDRGQNARTEALNLIRNRKGHLPHVVAVTAEPLPTRIASLALGTGDLDCVYHFALPELQGAVSEAQNEDQMDMLHTLIEGRRWRDISDLPFNLAT